MSLMLSISMAALGGTFLVFIVSSQTKRSQAAIATPKRDGVNVSQSRVMVCVIGAGSSFCFVSSRPAEEISEILSATIRFANFSSCGGRRGHRGVIKISDISSAGRELTKQNEEP